jgi:hypothetical protein
MTLRRLSLGTTLAMAACLAFSTTALGASNFPALIALPDGWQPEGITAGKGTTVFVGSLANGAIWKGNVRTGLGDILVPGVGGPAVGVDYEVRADRLWVAGGPTGEVRVYDARTGEPLETYSFPVPSFLNDVVVTRDAVYVTDSSAAELRVIPLGPGGSLPDPSDAFSLPLNGDFTFVPGEFNANGIVATRGWLLVVMSASGELLRVDPDTGDAIVVDLRGGTVASGDGMELRGSTLYVVRNFLNEVAVFRLGSRLASAHSLGTFGSPHLDIPTTAAWQAGRLWAVNARFATPPTPDTEYDIVRLPAQRSAALN